MRTPLSTAALLTALTACAGSSGSEAPSPGRTERVPIQIEYGAGTVTVDLVREEQVTTGWIDAPVEDAWRHLLGVYETIGFQVEDLTEYVPAARHVGVSLPRVRRIAGERPSRFLDCGYSLTAPKADQGHVRLLLSTWLSPKDGGTTVTTRLEASARDSGTSTAPIRCSSKGKLEQLIADRLLLLIVQESIGS
jgi:hypothetical protein